MSDYQMEQQEIKHQQMLESYEEPTNCSKCNYYLDDCAENGVCKFCIRKTFKVSGLRNVSVPSYVKVANEAYQEAKTYE